MRPVKLCVVTRSSRTEFLEQSFLARSLRSFPHCKLPRIHLYVDNTGSVASGLSKIYNKVLSEVADEDILLFVHDDVYIHEWLLVDRLQEAIETFDVVGLAGSQTPDLKQPAWGAVFNEDLVPVDAQEEAGYSGAVAHGDHRQPNVSYFGPAPQACHLMDGLFLAVAVDKVRAAGVKFDERFRFHCYDIDFCRSAVAAGLRVGTWPIAVTHQSEGNYDSPNFRKAAAAYLSKWNAIAS